MSPTWERVTEVGYRTRPRKRPRKRENQREPEGVKESGSKWVRKGERAEGQVRESARARESESESAHARARDRNPCQKDLDANPRVDKDSAADRQTQRKPSPPSTGTHRTLNEVVDAGKLDSPRATG
jgi:hypothetical protein